MAASRCYIAMLEDDGLRLDALLAARGLYPSRSAAAKAIEQGMVLVCGRPASKKKEIHAGDAIVYELPAEAPRTSLVGEPIPLDIRYEDEDMIVLSKQVGLVCHPSDDHADGTLVNALIYHCGLEHLCNVQGEQDRLGIVHRLDMDTSGLMLAAKTDEAGRVLMQEIQDRMVDRRYIALVHGVIAIDTGMIDAPIARHFKDRTRMAVRECGSAREAVTTFSVLERFEAAPKDDGYTLIECKLFTGRTHQIRVHMEYIHHPLVGDPLYVAGRPRVEAANLGLKRQFLHSYRLGFEHPVTGERLEFADNVPCDLEYAIEALSERSMGTTEAGKLVQDILACAPHPTVEGTPYTDQAR